MGRQLRARSLSCRELTEQTFARIRAEERWNSFITQTEEEALAAADERDKELAAGFDRGPFHGIPIAHKDNFYTRGVRTTGGSLIYRDFVPDSDSEAVERLSAAGAVCTGKTNMHELAYGITSKNPHYGFVRNPHDPGRIAGGSSGGSAALVAAGLLPLATGTDTGGSVRIPASYCGITGFKPTFGRLSVRGTIPLAFGMDTVGVIGSCVDDCALAYGLLAGVELDSAAPDRWRVGIPRTYFSDLDAEVETAVEKVVSNLSRLNASMQDVDTPPVEEMNTVARIIQMTETAALYHGHNDAARFGPDVWRLFQQGAQIAGHEYVNAQRLRTLMRRKFDALWRESDVLITPTTPVAAPSIESDKVTVAGREQDIRLVSTKLVRSFNLLGEPAISLPCGRTKSGLPIGLQIVAPPFRERQLLQFASAVESLVQTSVT